MVSSGYSYICDSSFYELHMRRELFTGHGVGAEFSNQSLEMRRLDIKIVMIKSPGCVVRQLSQEGTAAQSSTLLLRW